MIGLMDYWMVPRSNKSNYPLIRILICTDFDYLDLMTAEEIIGLTLTLLVMLVGFIGSVVPLLPGPPLVLIAAFGHRLWFGQHSASVPVLLYLAALTVAALLLDHFASVYGAKRFGATWRGLLGAFVGGVIGIFE